MAWTNRNVPHGFSRTGVLFSVLAVVVLMSLVWIGLPVLERARCGTRLLVDADQMRRVHAALVTSAGEFDGRYLTPSLMLASRGDRGETNHSAPLYSALLMGNYVSSDMLVSKHSCGAEPNESVRVKNDYDFSCYAPNDGVYWDPTFVMRIDDPTVGANASYAHLALCGERLANRWKAASDTNTPILSTRAPATDLQGGEPYTRSVTLAMFGPPNTWVGNVVYGDGRCEVTETFYPSLVAYRHPDGRLTKDDIFAAEFAHERGNEAANDAFLCISVGSTADSVEEVFDPLR